MRPFKIWEKTVRNDNPKNKYRYYGRTATTTFHGVVGAANKGRAKQKVEQMIEDGWVVDKVEEFKEGRIEHPSHE